MFAVKKKKLSQLIPACKKIQVKNWLEEKKDVRLGEWKAAEIEILNTFQLLTAKPVVYLVSLPPPSESIFSNELLINFFRYTYIKICS